MFEEVEPSIKVALYALTVLHLPVHSPQDWNKRFLLSFLEELQLSDSYFDAFYPLMNKSSVADEVSSVSSINSSSKVFLDMIDTAGLDRIDLFIGLSVYLRFRLVPHTQIDAKPHHFLRFSDRSVPSTP